MNGIARLTDGLDQGVSFLKRVIEALFQAVIMVGLACLIGLILAGTFGILHNGDDFDFDIDLGGGRGAGGDVIVLPGVLS